MEQLANDKVQNFLLGVTANAENFSMCEASAIDTPSEISFCGKKSVHVNFQQEPFIARLHDWLGVRENNLSEPHQLLTPEIEPGLNEEVLGLVEQMSSKVHSSIINKEEIRHHLSAPMPTSGLPLHYDYQRSALFPYLLWVLFMWFIFLGNLLVWWDSCNVWQVNKMIASH